MRRCIKSLGSTVGAAFIVLAAMGRSAYADESNSSARGAWLGLFVHRLSASARERAGGWVEGAEVVRVAPGGPAQQAGIVPGDVILSIGSRNISDGDDLKTIEATLEPGTPISVALSRDNGRVIKVTNVDPAESPAREASDDAAGHAEHADASPAPSAPEASAPLADATPAPQVAAAPQQAPATAAAPEGPPLGLRGEDLSPDLATALGVPGRHGILVLQVTAGSPAERAGIHAGDVVTRIGDNESVSVDGLSKAFDPAAPAVSIDIVRKGVTHTVAASLQQAPSPNDPGNVAGTEPAIGGDQAARDQLLLRLREEVRRLRDEVRRLREEVDAMGVR